ncbi:MAG: hypothetical protein ACOYXA_11335 [Bacteroidota bacterium]
MKLLACLLLAITPALAQIHADSGPAIRSTLSTAEFFTDVSGRPVFPGNYVDVSGTPFLQEDWQPAFAELNSGKKLAGLLVKLDLLKQELYYLDEQRKEMIAKKGVVRQLIFTEGTDSTTFRSGYPPAGANTLATYYQVLAEGTVHLLKHQRKVINETKRFNAATIERQFVLMEEYFLFDTRTQALTKIKKDKDSLLEALPDPQSQLKQHVATAKYKFRKEEDLLRVVDFYNSMAN